MRQPHPIFLASRRPGCRKKTVFYFLHCTIWSLLRSQ
ncbi:rCG43144, partial [Rattus norvegicus]